MLTVALTLIAIANYTPPIDSLTAITGRVHRGDGTAMPGAIVTVAYKRTDWQFTRVVDTTGTTGAFALRVPAGVPVRIRVAAADSTHLERDAIAPLHGTFDLQVVHRDSVWTVALVDTVSDWARVFLAFEAMSARQEALAIAAQANNAADSRDLMRAVGPMLLSAWRSVSSPVARQSLAIATTMFDPAGISVADATRMLAEADPRSRAYDFAPYSTLVFFTMRQMEARVRTDAALRADPIFQRALGERLNAALQFSDATPSVRVDLLTQSAGIAMRAADTVRCYTLLDDATREFPDSPTTRTAVSMLSAARPLRPHVPMPLFAARVIGTDSTVTLAASWFTGKLTLIDFWAQWCTPCVDEIPHLAELRERWKSSGFDVLSISMDESDEVVTKFRRTRHPMPWRSLRLVDGMSSPTARALSILSLPRAVLVDSMGMIVATDSEVRGANLEATLQRLLGGIRR
jgi:thiol-disulfide isomerase/thioredoxin